MKQQDEGIKSPSLPIGLSKANNSEASTVSNKLSLHSSSSTSVTVKIDSISMDDKYGEKVNKEVTENYFGCCY